MNGRVYDPGLGRFLSVDPVFQFPENTQSLNPYTYVLNSPLTFTDPTGLSTDTGETEPIVQHSDGSVTMNSEDGSSSMTLNENGQVTSVTITVNVASNNGASGAMGVAGGSSAQVARRDPDAIETQASIGSKSSDSKPGASESTKAPTAESTIAPKSNGLTLNPSDPRAKLIDSMNSQEREQFNAKLTSLRQEWAFMSTDEMVERAPALKGLDHSDLIGKQLLLGRDGDQMAGTLGVSALSRLNTDIAIDAIAAPLKLPVKVAVAAGKAVFGELEKTTARTISVEPNPYDSRYEIFVDGRIVR